MSELAQNLRKRTIEVINLIADPELQRVYQERVPGVSVPHELFNQWDETFCEFDEEYRSAFTILEWEALLRLNAAMLRASDATPVVLPSLQEFSTWDECHSIVAAAGATRLELEG